MTEQHMTCIYLLLQSQGCSSDHRIIQVLIQSSLSSPRPGSKSWGSLTQSLALRLEQMIFEVFDSIWRRAKDGFAMHCQECWSFMSLQALATMRAPAADSTTEG